MSDLADEEVALLCLRWLRRKAESASSSASESGSNSSPVEAVKKLMNVWEKEGWFGEALEVRLERVRAYLSSFVGGVSVVC